MTSPLLLSPLSDQTIFEMITVLVGTLATIACALVYLRRVRMERPAIGRFNGRDVIVLLTFLVVLPTLYVWLPQWALTGALMLTFAASLSIGFREIMRPGMVWLVVGLLIGADIWLGRTMLGTELGWQIFWVENSIVVLLAAVTVANLYVQGGMRLRVVAWLGLVFGAYDLVFTAIIPVTEHLVEHFIGFPLNPEIGFRVGFDDATVGLGDVLVYALFAVACYKAYGRGAAWFATGLIVVFGVALPSLTTLVIHYIGPRTDILVPAQTWFGPFAFLGYLWLRRHYGPERTMREFWASSDVVRRPDTTAPRPEPEPAAVTPASVN
ncbi:MAG TPA: hypothetical protein VGL06_06710 [Pseudonocardiaceae bacterium]|jgi:hypothetical protein